MAPRLSLSRIHFPVTTLGPGRRIGIWLQGCSIRCPGCISADTWPFQAEGADIADVLASIEAWLPKAEGITVSGGEPFDQPQALLALLRALRARTAVDILVYSGYPLESLDPVLCHADGLIDALVSDPFDRARDQTLPLRGSDNQRLHRLTELGRQRFTAYDVARGDRSPAFDVMFDADGAVWLAGIPRPGDLERLAEFLEADGHSVITSEDRRRPRSLT